MLRIPSAGIAICAFGGEVDLVPDIFNNISEKNRQFSNVSAVRRALPLAQKQPDWKSTVIAGLLTALAIEALQPIFGRSLDINDIILNFAAVLVSASAFLPILNLLRKRRIANKE